MLLGRLIWILPLAGLAGCAGTPAPVPGAIPTAIAPAFADAPAAGASSDGLVAPADTLSVNVYREPDLSMQSVVVASDGTIQMPLLGNVKVAGRTAEEVSQMLARGLGARYLVDPRVAVNVVSSPTRNVTIEGAVVQPGTISFLPQMSLLDALAQARGTTRTARTDSVTILRTIGDARYLAIFDVNAIRAGRYPDVTLQPGDTIVVGISGRRQTYQDFLQAAPLLGLFTRF